MTTRKIFWGSLTLFLVSSLGCLNETEDRVYQAHRATKEPKITVEVRREEPVLAAEPIIEAPIVEAIAPSVSEVLVPEALAVPEVYDDADVIDMRYARSPFDDNSDIPPWRANYVGSYGVLPTRFNDKGPYLYSFDRRGRNEDDF